MMEITTELICLGASDFAAQETNVHWDPATHYQMYMQCKRVAPQIKFVTSFSQEPASDWYKPVGTLLLALGPWTSCIVNHGSDTPLGHWSYIKFVGKNNK